MSNVLLGCAIGDALGVPFEKKLPNDPLLLNWDNKTFLGSEHHKLLPGNFSDDTQLSIEVASSLIKNNGFNPDDLSKRYEDWFFSGRARGYGKSTAAALTNLKNGMHWSVSGVDSIGNGSAMRAASFGIFFRNDIKSLIESATIDAKITHNSDEAIAGSIAIALTAAYAVNNDLEDLLNRICQHLPDSKVKRVISSLDALLEADCIEPLQVLSILGTKADVRETVPSSLFCFIKFDNYAEAVVTSIRAAMDADTTAAIVGSLFGAKLGMKNIPKQWISQVEDSEKLMILDSQLYNRSNNNYLK